jgi:hypothetical protein
MCGDHHFFRQTRIRGETKAMSLTKLPKAWMLLLAAAFAAGIGQHACRIEAGPGLELNSDVSRLTEAAAKYYAALRPRPEDMKWRQIPWLTDLGTGIRTAKEEGRPLLIWTSQQSHPLERC